MFFGMGSSFVNDVEAWSPLSSSDAQVNSRFEQEIIGKKIIIKRNAFPREYQIFNHYFDVPSTSFFSKGAIKMSL